MTHRYIDDQRRTIGRAIESGAVQKTAASWSIDAAGKCQNPVGFTVQGRPSGTLSVIAGEFMNDSHIVVDSKRTSIPLYLDGTGRCRKCSACLQYRANTWRRRCFAEIQVSMRTWFTTLTLRPERAYYYLERSRQRRFEQGVDVDADDPDERFRQWAHEIGKELTLFIKRVRKNSGAKIRHCFVFERHRSGNPHIHGLIHECSRDDTVTKRQIQFAWHDGFSNCKLVDTSAAFYVTKYVSKDAAARIRASVHYGGRIENGGTPLALATARPQDIVRKNERDQNDLKTRSSENCILTDSRR